MAWLAQRERDLIKRIGPVLVRRFDELVRDWRHRWEATVEGVVEPPDLPSIARVALQEGVDEALAVQRRVAESLVASSVPLDRVVTAVLLWEETVVRRLSRDAVEDVFVGATAFNRLMHTLVLVVAEAYQAQLIRERDEVRRGLEETDRLKMELVSMISHDLQTPITTIQGCADSMLRVDGIEPGQRRRFLEMIVHNAERLARLIAQILEVSRIEAGALDLEIEELQLAPIMRGIVDGILPGTPIALDIEQSLPDVRGDRVAVERVLLNLVDNAVRYSPPSEPVAVNARSVEGAVEVTVCDVGSGVPESRREGLFSKFYQVDPSFSGRRGGSGLGLAIVRGLAEAMGGSAGYRPNEGIGSTFWVRFPVASTGDGWAS
jgi:signal transduction histidine kinase